MTPLTIEPTPAGQLQPTHLGSLVAFYDHGRRCGRLSAISLQVDGQVEITLTSGTRHTLPSSSEVDVIREDT